MTVIVVVGVVEVNGCKCKDCSDAVGNNVGGWWMNGSSGTSGFNDSATVALLVAVVVAVVVAVMAGVSPVVHHLSGCLNNNSSLCTSPSHTHTQFPE